MRHGHSVFAQLCRVYIRVGAGVLNCSTPRRVRGVRPSLTPSVPRRTTGPALLAGPRRTIARPRPPFGGDGWARHGGTALRRAVRATVRRDPQEGPSRPVPGAAAARPCVRHTVRRWRTRGRAAAVPGRTALGAGPPLTGGADPCRSPRPGPGDPRRHHGGAVSRRDARRRRAPRSGPGHRGRASGGADRGPRPGTTPPRTDPQHTTARHPPFAGQRSSHRREAVHSINSTIRTESSPVRTFRTPRPAPRRPPRTPGSRAAARSAP